MAKCHKSSFPSIDSRIWIYIYIIVMRERERERKRERVITNLKYSNISETRWRIMLNQANSMHSGTDVNDSRLLDEWINPIPDKGVTVTSSGPTMVILYVSSSRGRLSMTHHYLITGKLVDAKHINLKYIYPKPFMTAIIYELPCRHMTAQHLILPDYLFF